MHHSDNPGRLKKSWFLTKCAVKTIKVDKKLILITVVWAFIFLVAVILAFYGLINDPGNHLWLGKVKTQTGWITNGSNVHLSKFGYLYIIVALLILLFITTLLRATVTYHAIKRFKGDDPSIRDILKKVTKRSGSLLSFTLFSYTVGYILYRFTKRFSFMGLMLASLLVNTTWKVASFFAVPVIVTSDKPINPINVTKQSLNVFKKMWGESIALSIGMGFLAATSLLLYIGFLIIFFYIVKHISMTSSINYVLNDLAVFGFFVYFAACNMIGSLVKAALYHFGTSGEAPANFNKNILQQAFTTKDAKKVFNI